MRRTVVGGDFLVISGDLFNKINIINCIKNYRRGFSDFCGGKTRLYDKYQVLLPAAVVTGKTSVPARSGVSSFQRTEPNGRSSMRRTRTGSGPI